jgi:hypothetical protein
VSNERVISKLLNGKDLEGSGRGVIVRYYPSARLERLEETTKTLSKNSESPGRDLSPDLLDTKQEC